MARDLTFFIRLILVQNSLIRKIQVIKSVDTLHIVKCLVLGIIYQFSLTVAISN